MIQLDANWFVDCGITYILHAPLALLIQFYLLSKIINLIVF